MSACDTRLLRTRRNLRQSPLGLPFLAVALPYCLLVSLRPSCCVQLLENCFLVSATLILMVGMVFSADGFTRGSSAYTLLTVFVVIVLVGATASFSVLLLFEIYRSVKFAAVYTLAWQVEEEAVEEAVLGRRLRRPTTALATDGDGDRWQSGVLSTLRRNSSPAGRVSAAMGVPEAPAGTAGVGDPGDGFARGVGSRVARFAGGPLLQRGGSERAVTDVAHRPRSNMLSHLQDLEHDVSGSGVSSGISSGPVGGRASASPAPSAAWINAAAYGNGRRGPGRAASGDCAAPRNEGAEEEPAPVSAPAPLAAAAAPGWVPPPPPPPGSPASDWRVLVALRGSSAPAFAGSARGRRRVQTDTTAAAVANRTQRVLGIKKKNKKKMGE